MKLNALYAIVGRLNVVGQRKQLKQTFTGCMREYERDGFHSSLDCHEM